MNTTQAPLQIANPDAPHHHHPVARPRLSLLAWPAWQRVLAVLPLVLILWLGVWWAHMGANAW